MERKQRRIEATSSTGLSLVACFLLATAAFAQQPVTAPDPPDFKLNTVTVEAQRESLQKQVRSFVSAIAMQRFGDSLALWERPTPICPQVAGLSRNDGEYLLARFSQIAQAAGAPLGGEHCKPNFFVIVTEKPNELLKGLEKKHPEMYGEGYYTLVRKFETSTSPVRVWYNANLFDDYGWKLPKGNASDTASTIAFSEMRDLTSVIEIVDTRRVRDSGVSYGQLAAYIAMAGLAELRSDPKLGTAPTILSLFSISIKDRPSGLSRWDRAYLTALYHTSHKDRMQLAEMRTSIVRDLLP